MRKYITVEVETDFQHKEYCILCCHEIEHETVEHYVMLNFCFYEEFLESLEEGSLLPTPFGVREIIHKHPTPNQIGYNLSTDYTFTVRHAALGFSCIEEYSDIKFKRIEIGSPCLIPAIEDQFIIMKSESREIIHWLNIIEYIMYIHRILDKYSINDASNKENVESLMSEIEQKIEVSEAFAEWFGR